MSSEETTKNLLEKFSQLQKNLQQTNSSNEKIKILQKYESCKDVLKLIYDPNLKTNITEKGLQTYLSKPKTKKQKIMPSNIAPNSFVSLYNELCMRKITGNAAKDAIISFINSYKDYETLIICMFTKDLKVRIGIKLLNEAFPNLIPEFEVTLALKYEDFSDTLKKDDWYISRKLDGVRCLLIIKNDKIDFYSREGNIFTSMTQITHCVKNEIIPYLTKSEIEQGVVLDGEACFLIIDNENKESHSNSTINLKENFKDIVSAIRKKDEQINPTNFRMFVFDMIPYDVFFSTTNDKGQMLKDRHDQLKKLLNKSQHFIFLEQTLYDDKSFSLLQEKSIREGWEGLMIRKNTIYKKGRTKELLKVKNFQTEEYKVLDIVTGPFRIIDQKTNLEKTVETLASVIIEHKQNQVNVGSGFTFEERDRFYKTPKLIKNKLISVQFFEESQDKNGKYSLRFPIFKGICGENETREF